MDNLKLERFKTNRNVPSLKKVLITFSSLSMLILIFLVYKSHAFYKVLESHDVIKARVGNFIYNINYDLDGGSLPSGVSNPSTYSSVEETMINTPTKEGYTFKGWEGFSRNLLNLEVEKSLPSSTAYANTTKRTFTPKTYVVGLAHNNIYNVSLVDSLNKSGNELTVTSASGYGVGYILNSSASKTYSIKYNASSTNVSSSATLCTILFYKEDGTYISNYIISGLNEKNETFTTPNETYYMVIDFINNLSKSTSTFSNVQLEEGSTATEYDPYLKKELVIPKFTRGDISLKAIWEDATAPTLDLAKETYIEDDFSGWTLNNAYVDQDGILTLGENGSAGTAASNFYTINNSKYYATFDAYTTSKLDNQDVNAVFANLRYYDSNYQGALANTGSVGNGHAVTLPANEWTYISDFLLYYGGYEYRGRGQNVININFTLASGNTYSKSPIKIKNFQMHGEAIPNSFYLINVTASDNERIDSIKYAKGNQTKEYFNSNGYDVTNNQIRVEENGIYTVYVSDASGNSTIKTIEITNIV